MFIVSSAKIRSRIQETLLKDYPNINFQFCKNIDEAEEYLPKAEVLLTYGEDLTSEMIQKASKLQWIHVLSAGLDKMPAKSIADRDILVTNARGIHQIPMGEYTIAMMLQVVRSLAEIRQNQADKVWSRRIPMNELHGKTIGVLGAGAIGSEIARLAKAFNMKTIGMNRSGRSVEYFDEVVMMEDLNDILDRVDFLVSVLPKTIETESLLKKEHFEKMQEHAVFINIGRGTTVDQEGLIEAMNEKQIAHAVLDVMVEEPLPTDSTLWEMKNVTITPHISGVTPQYQDRAIEQFKRNLHVYQTGEGNYMNKIDLNRGY
ncbi:D-2-hydroxyacid dehydrogenase [Pseudalkalibacillus berkeleyi]|uniref:D-2-hydroxyacid dehydrogenase n=1 Tax=Pseudalkalibacillus berkeleyi TaxID=1069813 RepID=A0ABS9H5E4_9BACL|nr:D-2-hydroxyacid dehydrogenase [Pseudalkalibacillus berkeleyi]MCF6139336.1 D-2-hydroxyacid dehydrogenase [Pseudalkalibacillus berkeleyi]